MGRRSRLAGRFDRQCEKGALLVFAVFARFSLDSARTKIPIAKMAASQKINRAALDILILLFFYASAFGICWVETQLTLCDSVTEYCADACEKGKQNV